MTDTRQPLPAFCAGIQYFGPDWPQAETHAAAPVIAADARAIASAADATAAYQTLLAADALRYLTLQICGAKASGHPAASRRAPRLTRRW
jgi:hypothetical protein